MVGPGVVRWDVSAGCLTPRYVEVLGRAARNHATKGSHGQVLRGDLTLHPQPRMGYISNWSDPPATVEILTKCRRCAPCLRARGLEWTYRAQRELQAAARTWFGTMTLRPEEHWLASCKWEVAKAGRKFGELSPREQFQAETEVVSVEITRWLKRVRKQSGARLRYLLVAEAHKSGLPHYHVLVHEVSPLETVGERVLRHQWKLGHSKFKLVEGTAVAGYVAKYISKAAECRVRASVRYGKIGL